jgi:glycine/D-amino acid oxidase-like deaminating enzyme
MADVLVVGAGPVGRTMAAELARHGVRQAGRSVRTVGEPPSAARSSIWPPTMWRRPAARARSVLPDAGTRQKAAARCFFACATQLGLRD